MKKQYLVPSVTVMEFDRMDIVTASAVPYAGSNANGGPSAADAPKRRGGIWDED